MVAAWLCQRAAVSMWIASTERSQCHRTALMDLPVGLGHVRDMVWTLCSAAAPGAQQMWRCRELAELGHGRVRQ